MVTIQRGDVSQADRAGALRREWSTLRRVSLLAVFPGGLAAPPRARPSHKRRCAVHRAGLVELGRAERHGDAGVLSDQDDAECTVGADDPALGWPPGFLLDDLGDPSCHSADVIATRELGVVSREKCSWQYSLGMETPILPVLTINRWSRFPGKLVARFLQLRHVHFSRKPSRRQRQRAFPSRLGLLACALSVHPHVRGDNRPR